MAQEQTDRINDAYKVKIGEPGDYIIRICDAMSIGKLAQSLKLPLAFRADSRFEVEAYYIFFCNRFHLNFLTIRAIIALAIMEW